MLVIMWDVPEKRCRKLSFGAENGKKKVLKM